MPVEHGSLEEHHPVRANLLARDQVELVAQVVAPFVGPILVERGSGGDTPFQWTKTADDILNSVKGFCLQTSDSHHSSSGEHHPVAVPAHCAEVSIDGVLRRDDHAA